MNAVRNDRFCYVDFDGFSTLPRTAATAAAVAPCLHPELRFSCRCLRRRSWPAPTGCRSRRAHLTPARSRLRPHQSPEGPATVPVRSRRDDRRLVLSITAGVSIGAVPIAPLDVWGIVAHHLLPPSSPREAGLQPTIRSSGACACPGCSWAPSWAAVWPWWAPPSSPSCATPSPIPTCSASRRGRRSAPRACSCSGSGRSVPTRCRPLPSSERSWPSPSCWCWPAWEAGSHRPGSSWPACPWPTRCPR